MGDAAGILIVLAIGGFAVLGVIGIIAGLRMETKTNQIVASAKCPKCGSTRKYLKDARTTGMGWLRRSRQEYFCGDCNAALTGVSGSKAMDAPLRKEKACPYCGEAVLDVAVKCKHCGEFLTT